MRERGQEGCRQEGRDGEKDDMDLGVRWCEMGHTDISVEEYDLKRMTKVMTTSRSSHLKMTLEMGHTHTSLRHERKGVRTASSSSEGMATRPPRAASPEARNCFTSTRPLCDKT